MINTVVGSGTLITFPVLLAFGYAPVTANVSNTVGLVPGSVSGAFGYRRELAGQRSRVLRLGTMSVLGGITGAVLLLVLPASAFKAIVPVFIAIALVLTVLAAAPEPLAQRRGRSTSSAAAGSSRRSRSMQPASTAATSGRPRGFCCSRSSAWRCRQDLHRTNALKNVLAGLVNGVAGVYFIFAAHVAWAPAAIIAGGSILGAQLGARYGRRLAPGPLRAIIVAVGIVAIVRLLTT